MKKIILSLALVAAMAGSALAQGNAAAGKKPPVKPAKGAPAKTTEAAPVVLPHDFNPNIAADPRASEGPKGGVKPAVTTKAEKNAKASNDALEIGRTQLDQGNVKEALEYLDKSVKLQPSNAQALMLRGKAKVMRKMYPEGAADLTKAMKQLSTEPEVYFWRGRAKQELDKDKEAVTDFTKVIELKPDYADAYYWRGHSYSEMDMLKESACPDFAKAAELNSELGIKAQKKYCK